jgi:tetratricopeptide (TPR) repeat protein
VSEQQLHALQQKEFVQRARRSSVAGETEFAFKHVLVRDVAYGQIPRADRAHKHARAAQWIESLGRSEDHAEMVAHHYSSALELARAVGQDVGDLVAHARTALREAGEHALTLNALAQAEESFRRALELTEPRDPERPRLLLQYGRVRYLRDLVGVEEIMEAREGLSEAGDRDGAAEASLMLADIEWQGGNREGMLKELEAARRLVDGASRSRTQVAVLADVARYEMLADRLEPAIELGREALALAEELGLEDLRSHALNTIGVARADMGDRGGFDDLEASIEIATRGNFVSDLLRGHNNRQALYFLYGELTKGRAAEEVTLELARHFGQQAFIRFIEAGPSVGNRYLLGEWDDALERVEAILAEAEAGTRFYQIGAVYCFRGLIRLARGDEGGAESDAELAIKHARETGDPQALHPDLAMAALVLQSAGNDKRADETLSEALDGLRGLHRFGFAANDLPSLAWVAVVRGRESELMELIEREAFVSPWLRAAAAVLAHDFRTAAEIYAEMGSPVHDSFFRLRAAEQLVAEGRRAEADEQLRPALAFYRSVGATRYVREGEALLAESA